MNLQTDSRRDWIYSSLVVLALTYALLAGLRTVSDFDLGWQLATGRYLVEHHQIPRVELFSYTAHGNEWIYPPFSGAIFYLLYLLGGYAALSWLGALACATTTALVCSAGRRATAALAFIAAPTIAFRTIPRAELFTTLLFAAVLGIVWKHHTGKPARLWILPLIFLAWANLHLGFLSGLAVLGAGILFEACDLIFAERRATAREKIRRLATWLGVSIAATLVNPWGWRIYEAIYRQNKVMQVHSAFITEWASVQLNSLAWRQAVDPRNPASADWWLLAAAVAAILAALWRKRLGPPIVLAAGIYLSLEHIRLQALFAILVAIIGGGLFRELAHAREARKTSPSQGEPAAAPPRPTSRIAHIVVPVGVALLAILGAIRVADLVSNRYYIDSEQLSLFGAGASWWYPERAAAFLEREHLPRNIFHDYGQGGFLAWRLGPNYPVFVDGRYIPFGKELFAGQSKLTATPPDSPDWKAAAERWGINTVIFPVARYAGLGRFPLQDYCESGEWKLVYLDEVSVIFVRFRPENEELVRRLALSCATEPITLPPPAVGDSHRARGERFNFFMNAASLEYVLSRDKEAALALEQAEQLFPDSSNLHLVKAQFFAATNRPNDAEQEYLRVVRSNPSDAGWYALARLYSAEHRYDEAIRCVKEAVPLSQAPYERLRALGVLYVYENEPREALAAFARAEEKSPYRGDSAELGNSFQGQLAEGRARAYRELNDLVRAVEQQELAVKLAPQNAAWWATLADLYAAQGQAEKADATRKKSKSLQDGNASSQKPPSPAASHR
ncbi:MAG TPA: tetratricopeptide repeat protein [Candidatus Angelobacter sp.]|nr:tetratricopeptide repeat protein [Candidatus Angelobacter sp.]